MSPSKFASSFVNGDTNTYLPYLICCKEPIREPVGVPLKGVKCCADIGEVGGSPVLSWWRDSPHPHSPVTAGRGPLESFIVNCSSVMGEDEIFFFNFL